ncbi:alpha/beta hydrolase fold domain-containing protein [Aureispira anguillae]|uniref:Alpha/beta hydrolase fold domain-containing protein n=1 Tax=Aureispira anguillae TaxID=2864201 RepID=A0A916DP12_9BACT|nr:alpha/beta hydrolase fold domain-containing protein [Aureispira anguillae]BDS10239.1 alpha/beta hydrolase fold domain-containing protein [Aureispira anguillae]
MQKNIFTILILLSIMCSVNAQNHATCNGTRYVSEEFGAVDTTLAVLFGNNVTYAGNNQDLYMDIYEPVGDMATARPAIVLAFGGSFIGGNRGNMSDLCQYYAQRGFVAVTIDYRLYDGALIPLPNATTMTDVVIKAVSDMKAAVRFLKEDAATNNTYKIDPDMIFVGGISAGGIVASHTAYIDSTDAIAASELTAINNNGGFDGNSSANAGMYSSEVRGVVNFSGALRDADYIDANDPPLFSAHDDGDGTVPYGAGNASIFGFPIIAVEGSSEMHTRATTVGIANFLITIPNSTGHVSFFGGNAAQWQDTVLNTSSDFLHDNVLCPLISATNAVELETILANIYPNPSEIDMVVQFEDLPAAYNLAIYDNMGRQVFAEQNIATTRYILRKEYFTAGIYHVNINFKDSQIAPIRSKVIFR